MDARPPFKSRASPLPSYANAIEEKHHLTTRPSRFFTSFYITLPNRRRLVVPLPIPPPLWLWLNTKFGRKRANAVAWLVVGALAWLFFSLLRGVFYWGHRPRWTTPIIGDPPTLVYGREDLRRIWEWEIASGHYPSTRPISDDIRLAIPPLNPGIPPTQHQRTRKGLYTSRAPSTIGVGSKREYINIQTEQPNTAYPPRVPPGSVADLDVIMDNCDFSQQKYVRDCLEVMRLGAGLDVNKRVRRGNVDIWKYIYREAPSNTRDRLPEVPELTLKQQKLLKEGASDAGLWRRDVLEQPLTNLTKPVPAKPFADLDGPCDPDYPRIFHMFWAGPFNEKPYVAILSFLFTQNLGLHLDTPDPTICRPQFWMWINPGPAAAVPNPNALRDMFRELADSPWAAPFLHPRFKEVVKFKMWNTTEQLDGVPELKHEWRQYQESLFNSGGTKYKVPSGKDKEKKAQEDLVKTATTTTPYLSSLPRKFGNSTSSDGDVPEFAASSASPAPDQSSDDDLFNRLGSNSQSTYDRLSVVLSDMARFILCHRFGGTYLDADTIFLRDWEELWGWKGAFAYRWSRLPTYNTAVLRLNRGSALGTFLFRTAFRNGFDFHPMTIGKYTKDSFLEGLLLRLPDAMFDPAWLAQEGYQRDRPPFPMFTDFKHFFQPPATESAPPQMLGFDGFFKGAYSYHFHNFWWVPFDPARNFPDLGPKFREGEYKARMKLRADKAAEAAKTAAGKHNDPAADETHRKAAAAAARNAGFNGYKPPTEEDIREMEEEDADVLADSRDLAWSAVLKRTFEGYVRGERPNMYGEWLKW
ncbi:hypothetical protein FRB99_008932 [Tulasnella sp. 403]|nr:hypothetical protein FRB99_008932 [Tulasnella sp. 403]